MSQTQPAAKQEKKKDRPEFSDVYTLLAFIQGEVSVEKSLETLARTGATRYKYRNAEMILTAVKGITSKVGAVILMSSEPVLFCDDQQGGQARFYMKVTVELRYKGEGVAAYGWSREPEKIVGKSGREGMSRMQLTGASNSYAKKSALENLFGIADGSEDPDGYSFDSREYVEGQQQAAPTGRKKENAKEIAMFTTKHGQTTVKKAVEYAREHGKDIETLRAIWLGNGAYHSDNWFLTTITSLKEQVKAFSNSEESQVKD